MRQQLSTRLFTPVSSGPGPDAIWWYVSGRPGAQQPPRTGGAAAESQSEVGVKQTSKNKQARATAKQFSLLMESSYSLGYGNVNAFSSAFLLFSPSLLHSLIQCIFLSVFHPSLTFPKRCQYHLDRIVWDFHILSPSSFLFAYWTVCSYQRGEHNAWCDGKVLAKPR